MVHLFIHSIHKERGEKKEEADSFPAEPHGQKAIAAEMKGRENKQYLSVLGCFHFIVLELLRFNHSTHAAYRAYTLSTLEEQGRNTKLVNSVVALLLV